MIATRPARRVLLVGATLAALTAPALAGQELAPVGWLLTGSQDAAQHYALLVDREVRHGGSASGLLRARDNQGSAGASAQVVRADSYRGKRIRLVGYLRAADVTDWAGLWMRVDGAANGTPFDNMQDRPLQGTTDWQRCEIILDVPPTATRIVFGAVLAGSGSLWMDDLALTVADSAATPTGRVLDARPETSSSADIPAEPHNLDFESAGVPAPHAAAAAPPRAWESRQLTTRGLANLTAFARLLGYVRFFHPSEAGR
ncbi:MAG: hypothetical protein Q8S13_11610, partial [Dehalococcoidia bacterium]|nr:hypothetical protein [Dehalococcoidia bacterium]